MNVTVSPLKLVDFVLLQLHFDTTLPHQDEEVESVVRLSRPSLDLDFSIGVDAEETGFRLEVTIASATSPDDVGYHFSVTGAGFFTIDSGTGRQDREKLLIHSGIPMVIHSLRMAVASVTGFGLYGKLLFDSIDLRALLEQKRNEDS
jgi:preprotein translocase subunit SecB